MNKTEFNNLDIMEQIKYINNQLIEGNTLTNVCKSIGISRSTIRDRFEKIGYKYNGDVKQYESIIEIVEAETSEPIKEDITPVTYESSSLVVGAENEILTTLISNCDAMNEKYNAMNDKVNELYDWYILQSSNLVVEAEKFKVEDFEGDIVVRSYKLYEPIQREFLEFCKKNNKYKVQDILSQFIKEGLEKYR